MNHLLNQPILKNPQIYQNIISCQVIQKDGMNSKPRGMRFKIEKNTSCLNLIIYFTYIHRGKLTWQGKTNHLKMYLLRCLYHAVSFLRVYDLKWRHFKFIHVHMFHLKLSPCINSNSCHQWGNQRCGACRWGISGTKTCFKILQEQRSWECQLCFCRTWMTMKHPWKQEASNQEH